MQKINVNMYPSNGYFFKESDGSVHRAPGWKAVIRKVEEYRARKRLPIGDVAAEVVAQACQRQPSICYSDRRGQAPINPRVPLKAKVLLWLNSFLKVMEKGNPLQYVEAAESQQRAAVCAKCPLNVSLGTSECSTCKQALAGYRDKILGRGRARDGRLGGCSGLGVDLITAVHLDELRVDGPGLPGYCWRKRTL